MTLIAPSASLTAAGRLVVVGAGPQALAVLAALAAHPGQWPASVTVVDPAPGWCTAWDEKLRRLQVDRLRSPQVHHPGARPMELRDLVEDAPAGEQLALRREEDQRVPTPRGMRRLIELVAARLGPLERINAAAVAVELGDQPGVRLEDGRLLAADRIVLAHNPSAPRLPDWALPLVAAGRAQHASTVDLNRESLAGRHVTIVGGGLTAGSLALAVARGGGRATLLTRRPLRARPYDTDASWLGPRRLREFAAADWAERRRLIDVARDGGTMPVGVIAELRALAATPGGGLEVREGVDVEATVREQAATAAPGDALWLATGYLNDVRADPLTGPLVAQLGTRVFGGLPEVTTDLRVPGSPVHLAGPFAGLGVGPACRNLSGSRPAGARIAAGLSEDRRGVR